MAHQHSTSGKQVGSSGGSGSFDPSLPLLSSHFLVASKLLLLSPCGRCNIKGKTRSGSGR